MANSGHNSLSILSRILILFLHPYLLIVYVRKKEVQGYIFSLSVYTEPQISNLAVFIVWNMYLLGSAVFIPFENCRPQ